MPLKNTFHVLQILAVPVICCQGHLHFLPVAGLAMRHFLIAWYVKTGAVVMKISLGVRYVTQLQRGALFKLQIFNC